MLDPGVILCERCGYDIGGLTEDGACPECGRPIRDSHPGRRIGSAWQRGPGPVAWALTVWRTLTRPWARWAEVRPDARSGARLLWLTCVAAALVIVGAAAPFIRSEETLGRTAAIGSAVFAGWALKLVALSWIESRGIRLLGRARRLRVTRGVAYAVVGHASAGWLAGSVIGAGCMHAIARLWRPGEPGWPIALGPAGALAVGLMWFETLTYLGLRRMRFANHPPRTPPIVSAGSGARRGVPSGRP